MDSSGRSSLAIILFVIDILSVTHITREILCAAVSVHEAVWGNAPGPFPAGARFPIHFWAVPEYTVTMKKNLSVLIVLWLFAMLVIFSGQAAEGARQGLAVCANTLIPSLFPFFVLAGLLSALGLPDLLGGLFGGAMGRLFRVSPGGSQAFFLGISGGYPLGASVVADLRREGRISRREAERLLAFCNNSGPAFIIGAAGGVFHSPRAGLLLYMTHVLAAVTVCVLFRGKADAAGAENTPSPAPTPPFGKAMTAAVSRAIGSTASVCGYVVLFGALMGLIQTYLSLPPLADALVRGFLELGGGVAALAGQTPGPGPLAAAALITGWGGLSVHCQTMSVLAGTDISCARHLAGRALCGIFAALYTFAGASLFL